MRALVVYEPMFGNTHSVATAIAAGLRSTHDVTLVPVTRATADLVATAGLLIVGGPTHMHGMSSAASRRSAAETGGFRPLARPESFLVSRNNTLLAGEAERAGSWGARIGEAAREACARAQGRA